MNIAYLDGVESLCVCLLGEQYHPKAAGTEEAVDIKVINRDDLSIGRLITINQVDIQVINRDDLNIGRLITIK